MRALYREHRLWMIGVVAIVTAAMIITFLPSIIHVQAAPSAAIVSINGDEEEEERLGATEGSKEDAEKEIRDAEEEKEEVLREAQKEGVELPSDAFDEFDSLLSQANAAFDTEDFEEAERLTEQAEESLESVEDIIDDLEKEEEEDVLIDSNDEPLERHGKLKHAWVVFHEANASKVYAIKKTGTKHEIQTVEFFTAFNTNYLVKVVRDGRLENHEEGDPITSIEGLNPADWRKSPGKHRLVKVPHDSAVFLVTPEGQKRVIIAEGPFHRFGWEFRDVEEVTQEEVDALEQGSPVDDSTLFDEEVIVKTSEGRKLRGRLLERLKLRGKSLVRNRLLKVIGRSEVYIIDKEGRLHHIPSEAVAEALNLNLLELTEVTQEELSAFEIAPPLSVVDGGRSDIELDFEVKIEIKD